MPMPVPICPAPSTPTRLTVDAEKYLRILDIIFNLKLEMETTDSEITYLKEYIEYLDGQVHQRDSLINKLTSIAQSNS